MSDVTTINKRKAEIFLLPLIINKQNDIKRLITEDFVGVYYKDTNKPEWENKIIIVYKFKKPNINPLLFFKTSKYKYNQYEEEIDGEIYNIFAFVIPPDLKKDYEKIINGKYDNIWFTTKQKIENAWNKCSIIHQKLNDVLTNNPCISNKYKKIYGQLLPPFDKNEILNLNKVPV